MENLSADQIEFANSDFYREITRIVETIPEHKRGIFIEMLCAIARGIVAMYEADHTQGIAEG